LRGPYGCRRLVFSSRLLQNNVVKSANPKCQPHHDDGAVEREVGVLEVAAGHRAGRAAVGPRPQQRALARRGGGAQPVRAALRRGDARAPAAAAAATAAPALAPAAAPATALAAAPVAANASHAAAAPTSVTAPRSSSTSSPIATPGERGCSSDGSLRPRHPPTPALLLLLLAVDVMIRRPLADPTATAVQAAAAHRRLSHPLLLGSVHGSSSSSS
jgi:hypothetical protein